MLTPLVCIPSLFHLGSGRPAGTVPYPAPGVGGDEVPTLWQVASNVGQLGVVHPRIGVCQLQVHCAARSIWATAVHSA
jgi:hypothetical protein